MTPACFIIEPLVLLVWVIVVVRAFRIDRRSAGVIIPLAAAPFSAAAELINRTLFAAEGTVYPATLWAFPGSDFPVAIVLFSGLYAFFLYRLTRFLIRPIRRWRPLMAVLWYLLLLLSVFAVEAAGTASGYWHYQRTTENRLFLSVAVYGFYLFVTAPAVIIYLLVAGGPKDRPGTI